MKSYQETIKKLEKLAKFGVHFGLDQINSLLAKIGNPHLNFESIHVAGTNGKGTVCAFLSSILKEAGYKVGMYTSPHLIDYRERFKINNVEISKEKFVKIFERVKSFSNDGETEFEILTAMAFAYFAQEKVDWAVVEVGLGGRLDATNVLKPLVTIITNIDYDHTDRLGEKLSEIAFEKAGIIKKGVPLITAENKKEPLEIIKNIAQKQKAKIIYPFKLSLNGYHLPSNQLLGDHFMDNAKCALAVIDVLKNKDFVINKNVVKKGLAKTFWPGRGQIISKNPLILLDAAHNPAGIKALCKSIKKVSPLPKKIFIFGMLKRKNFKESLRKLRNTADFVFVTKPKTKEEVHSPQEIYEEIRKLNIPSQVCADVNEAINKAKDIPEKNKLICITGSLYMIGEVLKNLNHALGKN